jgi:hypothetical protein
MICFVVVTDVKRNNKLSLHLLDAGTVVFIVWSFGLAVSGPVPAAVAPA